MIRIEGEGGGRKGKKCVYEERFSAKLKSEMEMGASEPGEMEEIDDLHRIFSLFS